MFSFETFINEIWRASTFHIKYGISGKDKMYKRIASTLHLPDIDNYGQFPQLAVIG